MKRRIRIAFAMAAVILTLVACKEGYKEQVREPEPLVIEIPEPCHTGEVIVYGEGVQESHYIGTIEIINDGKNGKKAKIIVHTGGEDDEK